MDALIICRLELALHRKHTAMQPCVLGTHTEQHRMGPATSRSKACALLRGMSRLALQLACAGNIQKRDVPQLEVAQQGEHLGASTQEGEYQEGLPAIAIAPPPHHGCLPRHISGQREDDSFCACQPGLARS